MPWITKVANAPIISERPIIEVAVARWESPNQTFAIRLIELNPNGAVAASIKLPTKIGQKLWVSAEAILVSAPIIYKSAAILSTLSLRMLLNIKVARKLNGM